MPRVSTVCVHSRATWDSHTKYRQNRGGYPILQVTKLNQWRRAWRSDTATQRPRQRQTPQKTGKARRWKVTAKRQRGHGARPQTHHSRNEQNRQGPNQSEQRERLGVYTCREKAHMRQSSPTHTQARENGFISQRASLLGTKCPFRGRTYIRPVNRRTNKLESGLIYSA